MVILDVDTRAVTVCKVMLIAFISMSMSMTQQMVFQT